MPKVLVCEVFVRKAKSNRYASSTSVSAASLLPAAEERLVQRVVLNTCAVGEDGFECYLQSLSENVSRRRAFCKRNVVLAVGRARSLITTAAFKRNFYKNFHYYSDSLKLAARRRLTETTIFQLTDALIQFSSLRWSCSNWNDGGNR